MSLRVFCGLLLAVASVAPVTASARDGSVDVVAELNRFIELVDDDDRFHPDTAALIMQSVYETVFWLDPEAVDLSALDADPMALVNRLFDATLALDRRMAELHRSGAYTAELADAKRHAIRALRRMREWAQLRARKQGALPATLPPIPALHGIPSVPAYSWVSSREEPPIDDLPRTFFLANSWPDPICSTITRATEHFQSFCHFTVGHVIDRELEIGGTTYPAGSILAIEAAADRGVMMWPLENHLLGSTRRGTTRESIFFVADPAQQVAVDEAAERFAERVVRAINEGSPLGYDFTMGTTRVSASDMGKTEDESKGPLDGEFHFCSGIGAAIGKEAGAPLFTHLSRFAPPGHGTQLLDLWGIDRDAPVAAPGDVDKSVALRRVAEGVRLDSVAELHGMHATLGAMVEWARYDRYGIYVPGWLVGTMRVVVGVGGALRLGFIPRGIPAPVMASFVPVILTVNRYSDRMAREGDSFEERYGRTMWPHEQGATLERLRDEVNTRPWFVQLPVIEGSYTLEPSHFLFGEREQIRLVVARDGRSYRVTRTTLQPDGRREEASGRGEAYWDTLSVALERPDAEPLHITYRIDSNGEIHGRHEGQSVRAGRGRRSERGRRVMADEARVDTRVQPGMSRQITRWGGR